MKCFNIPNIIAQFTERKWEHRILMLKEDDILGVGFFRH